MEEIKLPQQFVNSLSELLQIKETDLDWAKKMANIDGLPSGWAVKDYSARHRRKPMEDHSYYLACDESVADKSFALFQKTVLQLIEAGEYTKQGMTSLLFFIHTIGFVYDQELYVFQKEVAHSIPEGLYTEICKELIDIFNEKYQFSEGSTVDKPAFLRYEDLFRTLQYIDRMNSPVRLLVRLLQWRAESLPFVQMISSMKPDVRVSVLEFPYEFILEEEAFIEYLRIKKKETAFWATFLMQYSSSIGKQYSRSIIDFFVFECWDDVGQYLFHRVYVAGGTGKVIEQAKEHLASSLDSFLKPQFFEKNGVNKVLTQRSDFVTELSAISGWLYKQKDTLSILQINASTQNAILQLLACHLKSINSNLPGYVSGKSDFYSIWFSDPYDPAAQISFQLLQVSMLLSDKRDWGVFYKVFKSLCYSLRLMFYGSFTAQNIARRVTNHIVTLLVTFPDVDLDSDLVDERIKPCILLFNETIAIHWVSLNEREDPIWNASNSQPIPSNMSLSFILERLQRFPGSFIVVGEIFKKGITQFSSVPWPMGLDK